jgi:CheY-like chemotaxis protein
MQNSTAPDGAAPQPHAGTILVVDDDVSVAASLVRLFRSAGLQAIARNTTRELFDYLVSAPVALITLDLGMPDMHGLECLRKLKGDPAWSRIPVIVFTAEGAEESRQAALRLGASEYVAKDSSWPADHMLALVKHHLGAGG